MKDCCIIIPIYRTVPSENEILSIERNLRVLKEYDVFFVHPFSLNTSAYESIITRLLSEEIKEGKNKAKLCTERIHFIPFKNKYFKSNKTYSRLLLSESFYRPFYDYEYMLIAQTDTYILNTKDYSLNYFIDYSRNHSIDYWGAPWPNGPFYMPYSFKDRIKLLVVKEPSAIHVGNGGFSLRHILNSVRLIRKKQNLIDFFWRFNEDMFFSYFALTENCQFNSAPMEKAREFALETDMKTELNAGNIPYALHAFEKHLTREELLSFVK